MELEPRLNQNLRKWGNFGNQVQPLAIPDHVVIITLKM